MNGIEAGKAYVKFLLDDKALKTGLAKVGAKLQMIGKVGLAATGPLVAGFAAATKAFVDAGDELDKMSQRVGFSVEALSELKYAAGQSGTSIDAIERSAKKMQVGTRGGYGAIKHAGRVLQAHRVSWVIHFGDLADGLIVGQVCQNHRCCNPRHLFACMTTTGGFVGGVAVAAETAREIWRLRGEGLTRDAIAERLGVKVALVRNVIQRQSWRHLAPPVR